MSRQNDPPSPIDAQMAAPPPAVPQMDESLTTAPAPNVSDPPPDGALELIQSKWAVLVVLFCVTGILGIPLLWINKKFSTVERVVWSVVVTIYTAILIWIVFAILMWSYRQIVGY